MASDPSSTVRAFSRRCDPGKTSLGFGDTTPSVSADLIKWNCCGGLNDNGRHRPTDLNKAWSPRSCAI